MTESAMTSKRVDRYVRGELDGAETRAFETELLESPRLQDALEVALGLRRAVALERQGVASETNGARATAQSGQRELPAWPNWALAASLAAAAVTALLWWRAEAENTELQLQLAELDRPVGQVLTVPLDIMRSADGATPDVRIRKPAGAALLVLDVEVGARLADARVLELSLATGQGGEVSRWSARPDAQGRVQVALRSDRLPDGLVSLSLRAPGSGAVDTRVLELLPN